MADRKVELYEQALTWAYKNIEQRFWDTSIFHSQVAGKLAELVVLGCCELLTKQGNRWEELSRNPPQGQETNAGGFLIAAYRLKEDAVWEIQEHFGLEQTPVDYGVKE